MSASDVLLMAGGVCWTFTYLAAIHVAHIDQSPAIPLFAVTLNLSWELIFTLVTPHHLPQRVVDAVWLALDCVILAQALRYFQYKSVGLSRRQFYAGSGLALLTSFAAQYALTVQMDGRGFYSAFTINAYMSVAFVLLFFSRKPLLAGQNAYIAAAKLLGTALSSLSFYITPREEDPALDDAYLHTLYVVVLAWDVLYIGLIVHTAGWRCWRWRLSAAVKEQATDAEDLYVQAIA